MKKFSNEYYLILCIALAFEVLAGIAFTSPSITTLVGQVFTAMGLGVYCLTFGMGKYKYRKHIYTGNAKRVKQETGSN